jgi:hypothetical protein
MSWTSTVLRLFADNSAKEPSTYVRAVQGDQIGRFFAHWAIVYLEQFFKYRSSPNLWDNLYALILTRNGLGYILGNFYQSHLVTPVLL